jgi:hypothetical protein
MGQKLDRDDYISSMGALQEFYFACGHDNGPMILNVQVIDESTESIDFELQVSTTIAYDNSRQTISLIWENSGLKNFKSVGLFGVYWALYNEMEYNENERSLLIKSSDSNKIVKVYAK